MISRIICGLLLVYKKYVSPLTGNRCRFYPSCCEYVMESFKTFSFFRAVLKSSWRLLRCGPWCKGGVDFVCGNPKRRDV